MKAINTSMSVACLKAIGMLYPKEKRLRNGLDTEKSLRNRPHQTLHDRLTSIVLDYLFSDSFAGFGAEKYRHIRPYAHEFSGHFNA